MKSSLPIVRTLILFACLIVAISAKAQSPTFSCYLTNEVRVSPSVYQFDIYLLNTSTTTFQYAAGQWGITVNSNVANGGTLTPSIVSGSSTLSNSSQDPITVSLPDTGATLTYVFNIAGTSPPGSGNGSIISTVNNGCSSPGTRIATFQIHNTVPFAVNSMMNHTFNFALGVGKTATKIFAYVGGLNIDITANGTFYGYNTAGTCDHNISLVCNLAASASTTANVSCNAGSNGSATASQTGGTAPFSYLWSNGQTTQTATNLTAGTYTVTVTDIGSCTATASATVTQPTAALSALCSGSNVSCNGGANGSASVNASGGTPSYNYAWSNGGTSNSISSLTAGTYSVTVTDSHGCTNSCSYTVTQPTALTASSSVVTNVSCNGGSNGSVSVAGSGGTSPYSGTGTFTGLSAGIYSYTITDANGCTATTSVTVTQATALSASSSVVTNVSCNGGSNGSVSVAASGGTSPYSGTGTFNGLIAGSYTYVVTDSHGCTATTIVTVTQPTALTASSSVATNVSCHGGSNGSISVGASGGTSPYSGTGTFTGLTVGTYTYIVTDANGCTSSTTSTVTEPTALTASSSVITNVSCHGGSNGSVSVAASGGTSPYNGTGTFTGLAVGSYTYIVTDAHGCTATTSVTITEPTTLTASSSVVSNVSCNGGSNGSVSVAASGGTSPYNGTGTFAGLPAGSYTYIVTDADGCTSSTSVTVTQPTALSVSCSGTNVSCNGGSNGSASVAASGGTPSYSYSWSSGQNSSSISGLTAGTYSVTVSDSHGCTNSCSYTVTQPTALSVACSGTNLVCNGGSNGTASVAASGGTTPYGYSWGGGQTASSINGVIAGTYSVTVTDANGCTNSCSYSVTQPAALSVSCSGTNASCNTGSDGSASVVASNGTSPYSYSWSNGANTSAISGIAAGTYTVTVTDNCSASSTCSFTVTQPPAPFFTCYLTNEVLISPTVYQFDLYLLRTGPTPLEYAAGQYGISINTAVLNGGVLTPSIVAGTTQLTNPSQAPTTAAIPASTNMLEIAGVTPPGCANSSIISNVDSGGCANPGTRISTFQITNSVPFTPHSTANLTFNFTSGAGKIATKVRAYICCIDNDITPNGIFTPQPCLQNISLNNCIMTVSATSTGVSCFGGSNGSATVSQSNGTFPFTYLWNNGQTTQTATGLSAGTYSVTVTDVGSCAATTTIVVTQPSTSVSASSIQNSPVLCNGNSTTVTISASGGTSPYSGTGTFTVTAGSYSYTVTDANGCTATTSITVTQPTALTASSTVVTNVSCNGGSNGSVSVAASGGTAPYSGTGTFTGLGSGTYTYTVTDANGCTSVTTVTVTQPIAALTASSSVVSNITCRGAHNGSASVSASGGTTPYSGTGTFTGLAPGIHLFTVTDANGCTATTLVNLTQPATSLSATCSATDVSCGNGFDGSISVTAGGGTPSYTYLWSNGSTTTSVTNLGGGAYTVTVTDSHGCTTTCTSTVNGCNHLTMSLQNCSQPSCNTIQFDLYVVSDGTPTSDLRANSFQYGINFNTGILQSGATITPSYVASSSDFIPPLAGFNFPPAGTNDHIRIVESPYGGSNTGSTMIVGHQYKVGTFILTSSAKWVGSSNPSFSLQDVAVGGKTVAAAVVWVGNSASTIIIDTTGTGDDQRLVNVSCSLILNPCNLSASASSTPVSCFNGSNGTATVSASGICNPVFHYQWSNGQTTQTATGLTAGTYSVTVTDDIGCTSATTTTVTQPPTAVSANSAVITNVSCNGGSNGSVSVGASGGTSPYSGTGTFTVTAGSYSYTVTDANGCTATTSITVTQPTALTASSTVVTNVSCNGGSNGSVSVAASGGTAPYSGTGTFTGLGSGTYTYTVTDANGCTSVTTVTVTQPIAALTASSSVVSNITCRGAHNGSASVSASGGTTPYSGTGTFTGLAPGIHLFTVTDANGCTATTLVNLTQPATSLSATCSATDVSCGNGFDGSISVTAGGGTPSYTYLWSNGSTTTSVTNLGGGAYTVTVTDSHGCTTTCTSTVNGCNHLTMSLQNCSQPSCNTIQFDLYVVSDGTPTSDLRANSFQYGINFNTGILQSGATITPSYVASSSDFIPPLAGFNFPPAGTNDHIRIVESPYGGSNTGSTMIVGHQYKVGTFILTSSAKWVGSSNPSFSLQDVAVGGKTVAAAVVWVGNSASTIIIDTTGTGDDQRLVNVSCSLILNPCNLSASASSTPVSCFNGSNGTATVSASGICNPVFHYQWSNGQTTQTATGLTAGTYSVTVTDDIGCTSATTTTVTQPPTAVSANSAVITNVSCNGGSNGSVSVGASGGTSPYSGTGTFTVTAGSYSYTVTDANGCTATTSITVTQPTALTASSTVVTNVSCNGGSNGSVSVAASGGTAPYSGTGTFSGLGSGTYSYTVTDSHGCTATTTVTVTQPTALTASSSVITNVSCNGGSNGSVSVSASGGTAPYSGTGTFSGLGSGTYSYTVTDSHGCTATTTVTVTQPTALSVSSSVVTNVSCNGGSNGSVSVAASGGTAPYSGTGTFSGLASGTYSYTVTDSHGCTATTTVTVTQPTALSVSSLVVTNVLCNGGSNGSVSVAASGGTAPYSGTGTFSGLGAGTYSYTVTDSHGCTATTTVTVTQPTALTASSSVVTNVSCNGGSNGSVSIAASGGTAPYSGTGTFTGLGAGAYTYTVTDANGCTSTTTATVSQPTALSASSSVISNVSCNGGSNGSIDVEVGGGTSPYSGGGIFTGLSAGTYTYILTDANGCTATTTATVSQPTALSAFVSQNTPILCHGGSTTVTVSASGGTSPYSGTGTITVNAGSYTYVVTDANGCAATASITITEPSALTASSSVLSNVSCNGSANGSIDVEASGGTSPYSGTGTFTGLSAGTYTYIVTDANGCTATTTATVSQASTLSAFVSQNTPILCHGGSTTITVSASGGTTPYNGTGTFTVNAGSYTYIVTDAHGCTATVSINVTEPSALTSSSSVLSNVSCNGGSNGSASVAASGGTAPYSGTGTFTGLTAGTYTYTVTDANGCTSATTFTISQPSALTISCGGTNVSCNGGSNGSASVTASGGTPGYTYQWSTGSQNCDISAAGAPNFIGVISPGGIDYGQNFVACNTGFITSIKVNFSSIVNPGAVLLEIASGNNTSSPAYTQLLAGPLTSGDFIINLTTPFPVVYGNTYAFSLGGTGTTMTGYLSLSLPGNYPGGNAFQLTAQLTYADLLFDVHIAGTNSINGLSAGTYCVTVTDANNCTGTCCYTVTQPTALSATCSGTSYGCNGSNSGSVSVVASGGTPSYGYSWSNGGTNSSISGLATGTYSVTVTDSHGCTTTCSSSVTQPSALTVSCSGSNVSCNGGSNGSASVAASGGTPGYTYLWDTSGSICHVSASGTVSAYGTVDSSNATGQNFIACQTGFINTITVDLEVNTPGSVVISLASGINTATPSYTETQNSPLVSGTWTITLATPFPVTAGNTYAFSIGGAGTTYEGLATSFVDSYSGGNAIQNNNQFPDYDLVFDVSIEATNSTSSALSNLAAGTYCVTVTDAHGCTGECCYTVTQPPVLIVTVVQNANILCNGGGSTVTVTATNGYSGVFPVTAGHYTFVVISAGGCSASASINVTEPSAITISASNSSPVCQGTNVNLSAIVSGGTGSFTYQWTGPNGYSSTDANTVIVAPVVANTGTYTLTVFDSNGCSTSATTTVTVNACFATLNMKCILEGYLLPNCSLIATLYDLGYSADPTASDTIQANLWDPSHLANTNPDYPGTAILHTNGTATVIYPGAVTGNSYYLQVKHRNHMETWSSVLVPFPLSVGSYDFTTSESQAYNNGFNQPMKYMASCGVYAFYAGDVTQDGVIDLSDMAVVDNDAQLFLFGYNTSDCNGDGATDIADMALIDNNAQLFLFYARP